VYALCVDNVGNNQTTATTTSSYCPIVLWHPLILLSLASPLGA
jgi:hypothetical protein